jgi:putative flavoprotein involved in K+ transport
MAGSLARASGARVVFRDDLEKHIEESEDRLNRVLSRIDDHIDADGRPPASTRSFRPPRIQLSPGLLSCDLKAEGINTVLWATGYRADLNWLQIEGATDEDGEALHQGGVSGEPGLYFLGMNFLRHRNSNTIRGVGRDARFLSTLVAFELGKGRTNAA